MSDPRYIDAERLKECLKPQDWNTPDERWWPEREIGAVIDAQPTADVQEVKHGGWEIDKSQGLIMCSVCEGMWMLFDDRTPKDNHWNFCPNCGAKINRVKKEAGKEKK